MGSTFMYTERYATGGNRLSERLASALFALSLVVLAAGAATFVNLQGPGSLVGSVETALRNL